VAGCVGCLRAARHERDELVPQLDESGVAVALDLADREEPAVEPEGGVDVADLQRDVIDPDRTRLVAHGRIRWLSPNSCQRYRCLSAAR
jgi:hypothetical protein